MQFFHNTNIDFIGKRRLFFMLSLSTSIIGLLVAFFAGVDVGIDFKGGTEIGVKFTGERVQTEQVRKAMDNAKFTGAEIKSYGKSDEFLVRIPAAAGQENLAANVTTTLKSSFPNATVTLQKIDKIGPKVGAELRTNAVWAILLSVLAILLYIAFRFEFIYGLGAIIALVHDVIIAFVIAVLFNKVGFINLELNQSMIAALLTVLGFSINDTVIIFDRIRENREKHKTMPLIPLINMSINETLSRTINTVMTAVIVLFVIVVFGGAVLQGFAFVMLIGFITGAYSSIYIASSFVIWYLENVKKVNVGTLTAEAVATKAKAAKA
jgi:preprotein translocase subunit SecF